MSQCGKESKFPDFFSRSRCCQIFRTVRLIRGIKQQSPDDKERYRLFIAQLQDFSTLGVLEAFMEEAPQVSASRAEREYCACN